MTKIETIKAKIIEGLFFVMMVFGAVFIAQLFTHSMIYIFGNITPDNMFIYSILANIFLYSFIITIASFIISFVLLCIPSFEKAYITYMEMRDQ